MTISRKLSGMGRRGWVLGAIAALALLLIFFLSAPATNRISSGSTWGSAPDGYRAWYEYMEAEGVSIERWQRPVEELIDQASDAIENDATEISTTALEVSTSSATLLLVLPGPLSNMRPFALNELQGWFEMGNRVIVLANQQPATAAPFSAQLSSDLGLVSIDTRRRLESLAGGKAPLLEDEYGTVVWQVERETGSLISTTTPFLAANAYAEAPGNFAFLSSLVQQSSGPVYVDEYVHGYKDSDVVIKEVAGSWIDYLATTPLLLVAMQAGVLLIVALLAQNRRFGLAKQLPPVQVNNSSAYIQALAGVLHKANNHDFLIETLTRAEQKALQRALGLGDAPVSLDTIKTTWQQTTGRSVSELNVLQTSPKKGDESMLREWLRQLQALHVAAGQRASEQSEAPSQSTKTVVNASTR